MSKQTSTVAVWDDSVHTSDEVKWLCQVIVDLEDRAIISHNTASELIKVLYLDQPGV